MRSLRFRCTVIPLFSLACTAGAPAQQPTRVDSVFLSDSARLGYTMEWPSGPGPFPVMVLVHGAGRTTRDEMANIVPRFLERGFAVFRYDKRGTGTSEGIFPRVGPRNASTTIPQLGRDAASAFRTACSAERIDRQRCGYFGASQAGWVLAEALVATPTASFTLVYSGTTVSVGAEGAYSEISEHGSGTLDSAYAVMQRYDGPPGYDPLPSLAKIATPMLWLLGEQDVSTPTRTTAQHISSLQGAGRPFRARLYPTYGHALGSDVWPDIDAFLRALPTAQARP